jgi:hypothetical protein
MSHKKTTVIVHISERRFEILNNSFQMWFTWKLFLYIPNTKFNQNLLSNFADGWRDIYDIHIMCSFMHLLPRKREYYVEKHD